MRCNAARVFIQENLDGPLSPPDEAMVEAHMASCEPCRSYKHSLCRIATGLGNLGSCAAPCDFSATITFQLGREKRRRQWAPIAAAAVLVAGFVTLKPLLGGTGFQVASQDALQPAATVNSNLSLRGGSILDAMPGRPNALFARRQPAAAPADPSGAAEAAPDSPAQPEAAAPLRLAVAGPGTPPGLVAEEEAAGAFGSERMAAEPAKEKSFAADAVDPDAMAKRDEAHSRSIASLPAESKALEAPRPAAESDAFEGRSLGAGAAPGAGAGAYPAKPAPAVPPAAVSALSAYRAETGRRSRSVTKRRALTPEEQMAVDMATFEMLRWMDPAADGGPHLEFQEVDFTLP